MRSPLVGSEPAALASERLLIDQPALFRAYLDDREMGTVLDGAVSLKL
jgi:hypothetical protein